MSSVTVIGAYGPTWHIMAHGPSVLVQYCLLTIHFPRCCNLYHVHELQSVHHTSNRCDCEVGSLGLGTTAMTILHSYMIISA